MGLVFERQQGNDLTSRGFISMAGGTLALQNAAINGQGAFRGCAPLPPEAGEEMDDVITRVGTERLAVVQALIEFAERPLPNWWSVMTKQYEKISRFGRANKTMYPGSSQDNALADRTPVSTAIYAIEEPFHHHQRFLDVAAASGVNLPEDDLREAIININETAEDAAINNPGVSFNNITMYGLFDAPNANTQAYSGSNPAWDHASKTGEEILDDYFAMRAKAYADKHYGPFVLFHETNYQTPLDKPYSDSVTTNYNATVREMLLKNNELLDIRVADQFADDRTALVEMSESTCGIYTGQDPTWIAFPTRRFVHEFLALACWVPYFRDDYDGGSGIVLGNTS